MASDIDYCLTFHGCTEQEAVRLLCDNIDRFKPDVTTEPPPPAYMGHVPAPGPKTYPDPPHRVLEKSGTHWRNMEADLLALSLLAPDIIIEAELDEWALTGDRWVTYFRNGEKVSFCTSDGDAPVCPWLQPQEAMVVERRDAVPLVARLLLDEVMNRECHTEYLGLLCSAGYNFLSDIAGVENPCTVDVLRELAGGGAA